jgi:hypothetical protein
VQESFIFQTKSPDSLRFGDPNLDEFAPEEEFSYLPTNDGQVQVGSIDIEGVNILGKESATAAISTYNY